MASCENCGCDGGHGRGVVGLHWLCMGCVQGTPGRPLVVRELSPSVVMPLAGWFGLLAIALALIIVLL